MRAKTRPYAVPTDAEVLTLLSAVEDERLRALLLLCLLKGMRLVEAVGLLRDDLVRKLKTLAAEREVPLHSTSGIDRSLRAKAAIKPKTKNKTVGASKPLASEAVENSM
jgi:integrase